MDTKSKFEEWRAELLHVGNIVQDEDDSVGWDEREARFNRYVEMLDALQGDEGFEYALAVFVNRPVFRRHLAAIIHGSSRSVHEQQAIHGRVQG